MPFSVTNVPIIPRVTPGAAARPSAPGFGMVLYGSKGAGDVPVAKVPAAGATTEPVASPVELPAAAIGTASTPTVPKNLPAIDPIQQEPPRFGDDAMPDLGDTLPTVGTVLPGGTPVAAFPSTEPNDLPASDPVQPKPPRFGGDALPDIGNALPAIGTTKPLAIPMTAGTTDPTHQPELAATDDAPAPVATHVTGRKVPAAGSRQALADSGTSLPAIVRDNEIDSKADAPATSTAKPRRLEGVAWPPHIFVFDPQSAPLPKAIPAISTTIGAPMASTPALPVIAPAVLPASPTPTDAAASASEPPPAIPFSTENPGSASPDVGTIVIADATTFPAGMIDPPVAPTDVGSTQPSAAQPAPLPLPAQSAKADAAMTPVDPTVPIQTGATLAAAAVVRASSAKDQARAPKADAPVTTSAQLLVDPASFAVPVMQPGVLTDPTAASAVVDTRDPAWTASLAARIVAAQDGLTGTGGRIRLTPDALGRVDVSIRSIAGKVHVTLDAETEGARKLLADAQPELVALAARQGATIASAVVTGGEPTGEPTDQPDHSRSDQPQQQPDRRNRFFGTRDADPTTTTFAALNERLA